jgi:hypothetical protein
VRSLTRASNRAGRRGRVDLGADRVNRAPARGPSATRPCTDALLRPTSAGESSAKGSGRDASASGSRQPDDAGANGGHEVGHLRIGGRRQGMKLNGISAPFHSRVPMAMPAASPPSFTGNVAGRLVTRQVSDVARSGSSTIANARRWWSR